MHTLLAFSLRSYFLAVKFVHANHVVLGIFA
jgi:hypothetical protein